MVVIATSGSTVAVTVRWLARGAVVAGAGAVPQLLDLALVSEGVTAPRGAPMAYAITTPTELFPFIWFCQ
ncbi:hypothetical protein YWA314_02623 [Yersinia enterocolitica subsp. enterocolitica WA-314]|nr:hypothetical protein YWA314_02623 [Yersinia enterocolitica subsp. enterocolitica WA-314]